VRYGDSSLSPSASSLHLGALPGARGRNIVRWRGRPCGRRPAAEETTRGQGKPIAVPAAAQGEARDCRKHARREGKARAGRFAAEETTRKQGKATAPLPPPQAKACDCRED